MSSELPHNFVLCEIVFTVGAIEPYDSYIARDRCPMKAVGGTVWATKAEAEQYLSQRGSVVHIEGKGEVPAAVYPVGLPAPLAQCVKKEGPFLALTVDGLLYPRTKDKCVECERKDKVLKRLETYLQGLAEGGRIFSTREMGFALRDVLHARVNAPEPPPLYSLHSPSELIDAEFFPETKAGASDLHSRPQTSDGETLTEGGR
jgi:hypothetical protein